MAKALLIQEEILRTTYSLTLTEDEAKALAFITRRIGGDRFKTPRGVFDAINAALETVGINRFETEYPAEGEIRFLDAKEAAEQEQLYGGPFVEDDPDYETPDYSDYEY